MAYNEENPKTTLSVKTDKRLSEANAISYPFLKDTNLKKRAVIRRLS